MRICVLGSGSSGNCTYVETRRTRILIDAGFGPRSLKRRLAEASLPTDRFDALLITHGHVDHYAGARAFAERFDAPVLCNRATREEVPELRELDCWEEIRDGSAVTIGDLTIESFPVLHDAADPVGFRLSGEGIAGAIATDLGEMTDRVERCLTACDWIVLESNHDEELVRIGSYPWSVKQRLLSRKGHLSNRAFADFLTRSFDGAASHVFLAHLSRNNNDPQVAIETARQGLQSRPRRSFDDIWNPCTLHLTRQAGPSPVISF